MTIVKIQEVDVQYTKKGKNGWHVATVTYTDEGNNKNFTKKLMSFKNPKVFGVIQEANPGDRFEVEVKKEGDFYEWVTITPASAKEAPAKASSSPAAARPTGRAGDWETAEERARKQVYIVKQSSITAALEFLKLQNAVMAETEVKDVLAIAQEFVDYVFESEDDEEMEAMDGSDGE